MADSMAYNAEKLLRDQADKVPAEIRGEVEGKIAALRSALQSGGIDQIRSAMNELSESLQKIGAAAYGQAGADQTPPGGEGEGSAPPEEGTVEGEFREV
jgi:molecular chaperone DnaK